MTDSIYIVSEYHVDYDDYPVGGKHIVLVTDDKEWAEETRDEVRNESLAMLGRSNRKVRSITTHEIQRRVDKPINYTGPDPVVRCAYEPCTNHLRRSEFPGPQWCSKTHREMTL